MASRPPHDIAASAERRAQAAHRYWSLRIEELGCTQIEDVVAPSKRCLGEPARKSAWNMKAQSVPDPSDLAASELATGPPRPPFV